MLSVGEAMRKGFRKVGRQVAERMFEFERPAYRLSTKVCGVCALGAAWIGAGGKPSPSVTLDDIAKRFPQLSRDNIDRIICMNDQGRDTVDTIAQWADDEGL